tara:strand:+ start:173 stop:868 length:696 start_codon:yes stop_codon:yes gene_type:complete
MNIAIIPARGGSKRIKKKNIKIFFNKPILHYTFDIIKKSKLFSKIILSTDDKEIAKVAKKIGFEIILKRSKKNSGPKSTTIDAVKECLAELNYNKDHNLCCIYPCSIFITKNDMIKGLRILKKNKNYFVYPVQEFPHPIDRAFILLNNNKIKYLKKGNSKKNTQSFKKKYYDSGQFYWGKINKWKKGKNLHSEALGFKVKKYKFLDIDDKDDLEFAKMVFSGKKNQKYKSY